MLRAKKGQNKIQISKKTTLRLSKSYYSYDFGFWNSNVRIIAGCGCEGEGAAADEPVRPHGEGGGGDGGGGYEVCCTVRKEMKCRGETEIYCTN